MISETKIKLNNMVHVVKMTDKEKLQMYMKCSKKELAKMLIECNKIIEAHFESKPQYSFEIPASALNVTSRASY